jgi:anti-sigma B factor antagonist
MPVILALLIPATYPGAGPTAWDSGPSSEPAILVKWEEAEGRVLCHVVGNLDELTSGEFRGAVAQLPVKRQVIFELSAVPYVDTAGLAAILGAVMRVRDGGGEAVICSPRPSVARLLLSIGLDRVAAASNSPDELGT